MDMDMRHFLDNRSRPEVRAVLWDWVEENGLPPERWLLRVAQRTEAEDLDTDVVASEEGVVYGGPSGLVADGVSEDDDDVILMMEAREAVSDDDDGDIAGVTVETDRNPNSFWRGGELQEGLVLIQVPGQGWGVTRVGWSRRIEGDEWEFRGVSVRRTGEKRSLSDLAARGPRKDHQVSAPDEVSELLHRFGPRRVLVASEAAWVTYIPKPDGW